MDKYKKRAQARLEYEAKVELIRITFLPLVKEAIASSDCDRLILLESQREFKLSQLLLDWRIIDDAIQNEL